VACTHDQYLDEPAALVDWFLQFEALDARVEAKQAERARGR
jgi:hypothetical protein